MADPRKKRLAGTELKSALDEACRGLRFISETDHDIIPILSDFEPTCTLADLVSRLTGADASGIEKLPVANFFERLTRDRDWHGPAERSRVKQFRELQNIVANNLDEPIYFRVGRIRIRMFVIGRDDEGNIAGFETGAVET